MVVRVERASPKPSFSQNVAYFLDFRPEFNEKDFYFGDFILEILQNIL